MNERKTNGGIIKDDRGVALTEFVIVIPIILLLFLAMLQYFEIVQSAQLGNYAAYAAARSYSVRILAKNAPDGYSADSAAKYSAALALAPVAGLASVSSGSMGGGLGSSLSSGLSSLSSVMGSDKFGKLIKGAGMAGFFLSLPNAFSANKGTVGSLDSSQFASADIAINYPQQINLPVFSYIWNFLGGTKIDVSMWPEDNATALGLSLLTGMPYVNIQSKCSTGCEAWSGKMKSADSSPAKYQSSSNWQ